MMRLHHLGLAARNIEATAELLQLFGYIPDTIQFDPMQNVNVLFCRHPVQPLIELIGGKTNDSSPIHKWIEKNGTCLYHLCYETDNLDAEIQNFRKRGYIPICKKTKSLIDEKDVIFLYHRDSCLIELLDCADKIQRA